jgi:hypothetical protein
MIPGRGAPRHRRKTSSRASRECVELVISPGITGPERLRKGVRAWSGGLPAVSRLAKAFGAQDWRWNIDGCPSYKVAVLTPNDVATVDVVVTIDPYVSARQPDAR